MNDSIKIKGSYLIEVRDAQGNLKLSREIQNITTNAGKAAIAGLVGNTGAITAFSYLALGTSSTAVAAADTTLNAEIVDTGLTRSAATVSRVTTNVTNDTLQLTFTWTSTGTKTVQEIGILNAASTGTLLSHALTGTISLVNTDTFVATYKVIFT